MESSGNTFNFEIPEGPLVEPMHALDVADIKLRMNYDLYLQKPDPKIMKAIEDSRIELMDCFGDVLIAIKDDPSLIDAASLPAVLAGLVQSIAINHATLLADYTDRVTPPGPEGRKEAFEELRIKFSGDDDDSDHDSETEAIGDAVDIFMQTMQIDMEIIGSIAMERASSPMELAKEHARRGALEVAKLGAGVFVGMLAYDKIMRRS